MVLILCYQHTPHDDSTIQSVLPAYISIRRILVRLVRIVRCEFQPE